MGGRPADRHSAWFPELVRQPSPALRLLCLPYAGGGCGAYRGWQALLGPAIEVWAASPPGRERRLGEPPPASMEELLDGLAAAADELLRGDWAVFGHSFGGLVAHALTERQVAIDRAPRLLVVSCCRPPWEPPLPPLLHGLPDEDFRAELRRLGGTPDAVLDDPGLMALFGPTLRADLYLSETWRRPRVALPVPLLAVGGERDGEVRAGRLTAWGGATDAGLEQAQFPGGHFYLVEQRRELLALLDRRLRPR